MIESYSQIFQNLKKDIYSNVYLLMGEETFYIDKISNHIEDNFIDENLKSFNQEVLYGRDSDIKSIISSCNSFPMMSDKKLILVKEAQEMDFFKRSNEKNIELFNNYLEKQNTSSLLVICHKNKSLDKRSKLYKSFLKNSTILDSSSKENKITRLIDEVKNNKYAGFLEEKYLENSEIKTISLNKPNALHDTFREVEKVVYEIEKRFKK